ncbi:vWA domain-containing protein [Aeromicrobium wangtongii]|uniref:VWA domain-containing protein n=1 Tax=Aeromicrobium wangtongii TaxID=2969247 RepID=A0ABY5M8B6_9ACTN|nr:VWA domain-containing protein [Aeromicrobium wangtongii]MCD9198962.1 VWA domain-containing protein [Aeromicrobium wangtongii]UUP13002.1 VWA domain-containing protein [Aeromicrobium wangtongii]
MRRTSSALTAAAIAVAGTMTAVGMTQPAAAQSTSSAEINGKLVLLLDASGSMKETATGGTTKIEAAKSALTDVVKRLPDDAQVGVRVFGATVENRGDKGACNDTQNVVPVGPLDRDGIVGAVRSYKPYGETPIGNALKGAAKDLGPTGKRTIVLLSDGEPTCDPDPCKVARDLRAGGIDLTVNVVGLNVSGKARSALQCIADAGGGTYYGVDEPDELASSLVSVSVRSLRAFRLTGTPVVGGTTTAAPLDIEPGRYTDTTEGPSTSRYYVVTKPKDSDVVVSAVARPPYDFKTYNKLEVELLTRDGRRCGFDQDIRMNVLQDASILTTGALFSGRSTGASKEPCLAATTLLARVALQAPGGTAFELLVSTRPPIEGVTSLPEAVTNDQQRAARDAPFPDPGPPTPVVGGAAFTDAPTVEPGTYSDTLRPGEQLIYKIPVGWGQRARARATLESDVQGAAELSQPGISAEMTMISPTLHSLGRTGANGGNFWSGERPVTLTAEGVEVRARNIESHSSAITSHSAAGDSYIVLSMGGTLGGDGMNFAAPVTLTIAVDGQENGEPRFAGKSAGPESGTSEETKEKTKQTSAAAEDSGGSVPWLPIGLGVLVVALVAGAFALGRRRPGAAG